jgi:hypothetical protein
MDGKEGGKKERKRKERNTFTEFPFAIIFSSHRIDSNKHLFVSKELAVLFGTVSEKQSHFYLFLTFRNYEENTLICFSFV